MQSPQDTHTPQNVTEAPQDTQDSNDDSLLKRLEEFKTYVKAIKNKEKLQTELAKYVVFNETTQLLESLADAGLLFNAGHVRVKAMNFCTKKYNHAHGTEHKWR